MPASDPNTRAHLEWLGYIQPHGLVVSPPALLKAGAFVNRQDTHRQALLAGCTGERELAPGGNPQPCIRDFREFAAAVLGWGFSPRGYAGFTEETPIPEELTLPLPDYGETLRPDFAVRERDPASGDSPWQLLVQVLAAGQEFDRPAPGRGGLDASAQGRAERLLRATGVRAGVLVNGVALRLISAPHGESSGWMDFRFADLLTPPGARSAPPCTCFCPNSGCWRCRAMSASPPCWPTAASTRTRSPSASPSRCCTRCTNWCAASRTPMPPPTARC